ncbi:MAG: orotate phosphoribosyltransferase, partial [Alkaliphilus sp.]|nr:orotate phosphoribosyltransferase [Alkaliphilus sp.]
MNFKEEIAKKLLEIDAISLTTPDQLFTWASGIKSPIYCDNRLVMSYPAIRDMVADALKDLVQMHYPDVNLLV